EPGGCHLLLRIRRAAAEATPGRTAGQCNGRCRVSAPSDGERQPEAQKEGKTQSSNRDRYETGCEDRYEFAAPASHYTTGSANRSLCHGTEPDGRRNRHDPSRGNNGQRLGYTYLPGSEMG